MKIKILEAITAGRAAVATSVSEEGIEAAPDRELLIANSPEEFALKTLRLLRDSTRCKKIAENGRKFR